MVDICKLFGSDTMQTQESYRNNFNHRKTGIVMIFTDRHSSMFIAIQFVVTNCIPTKVAKLVVRRISVIMTGLVSNRTRAYKCFKNKSMDIPTLRFTVYQQCKLSIACFMNTPFKYMGMAYNLARSSFTIINAVGPDTSMIRNLISRATRNGFPDFGRLIKLVFTHGKNLLQRFLLWGEPLSLLAQGSGSFYLSKTNHDCQGI